MNSNLLLAWIGIFLSTALMADSRQELLDVDRAFAALAHKEGSTAAFAAYAAQDAVVYRSGQAPIEGRDTLVAVMAKDPEATLEWTPTTATIATSNDLGFTRGTFIYRTATGGGATGWYVSIWQRQSDGSWKFVFDSGITTARLE